MINFNRKKLLLLFKRTCIFLTTTILLLLFLTNQETTLIECADDRNEGFSQAIRLFIFSEKIDLQDFICIFNNHLLFILIIVLVMISWVLFATISNYGKFSAQKIQSFFSFNLVNCLVLSLYLLWVLPLFICFFAQVYDEPNIIECMPARGNDTIPKNMRGNQIPEISNEQRVELNRQLNMVRQEQSALCNGHMIPLSAHLNPNQQNINLAQLHEQAARQYQQMFDNQTARKIQEQYDHQAAVSLQYPGGTGDWAQQQQQHHQWVVQQQQHYHQMTRNVMPSPIQANSLQQRSEVRPTLEPDLTNIYKGVKKQVSANSNFLKAISDFEKGKCSSYEEEKCKQHQAEMLFPNRINAVASMPSHAHMNHATMPSPIRMNQSQSDHMRLANMSKSDRMRMRRMSMPLQTDSLEQRVLNQARVLNERATLKPTPTYHQNLTHDVLIVSPEEKANMLKRITSKIHPRYAKGMNRINPQNKITNIPSINKDEFRSFLFQQKRLIENQKKVMLSMAFYVGGNHYSNISLASFSNERMSAAQGLVELQNVDANLAREPSLLESNRRSRDRLFFKRHQALQNGITSLCFQQKKFLEIQKEIIHKLEINMVLVSKDQMSSFIFQQQEQQNFNQQLQRFYKRLLLDQEISNRPNVKVEHGQFLDAEEEGSSNHEPKRQRKCPPSFVTSTQEELIRTQALEMSNLVQRQAFETRQSINEYQALTDRINCGQHHGIIFPNRTFPQQYVWNNVNRLERNTTQLYTDQSLLRKSEPDDSAASDQNFCYEFSEKEINNTTRDLNFDNNRKRRDV